MLGIGAVVCAHQLETIDVEALYATADGDCLRALVKVDEVINTANYSMIVPSSVAGVEPIRATSLGSAVFRNRILMHYEYRGLELPELTPFALPGGGAVAESLESHLVSKEETPQEPFVGGTPARLQEPHNTDNKDARSPIVVGHVTVGSAGSELSVGSLVTVGYLT